MNIETEMKRYIDFLKSVSFSVYDEEEHSHVFIDVNDEDILMVQDEPCRSRLAIVIKPTLFFELWVQVDIACGFMEIPLRWAEIEYEWLNNIKLGIQGSPLQFRKQ